MESKDRKGLSWTDQTTSSGNARIDDLVGLGMAAHQMRLKKKRPPRPSPTRSTATSTTRIFAPSIVPSALFTPARHEGRLHFIVREIYKKSTKCWSSAAPNLLQGGLHPDLQIGYYENLLRSLESALSASASALFFRALKFCGNRGSQRTQHPRNISA